MKRPFSKKQLQRCYLVAAPALFLVACGTAPKQPMIIADTARPVATTGSSSQTPVLPKAGSGKGGYYKDDGPGDSPPQGLESTVDPIPVLEDFSRSANKPYVVLGKLIRHWSTTPRHSFNAVSAAGTVKNFMGKEHLPVNCTICTKLQLPIPPCRFLPMPE